MTALLSVEARRFLARRLVRVLVGLAVFGMLLAGTVLFAKSHRLAPGRERALLAQAEANWEATVQACQSGRFGIPPSEIPPGESLQQFCEQVVGPVQVQDPGFHLTSLHDVYLVTNALLIALFTLLAASFVGAEWHAGTVTTLLTWEPRRLRVFLAKILSAAAIAFVGFVALQAVLGAALAPAAIFRGTSDGADAAWFRSVAGLVLRAGAVAAMGAAVASSLAFIGRNTAAALGVAFGYIAVIEPILRGVKPKWQPWLVYDNVATFIVGHAAEFTVRPRTPTGAGLLVGVYVVALAAVAAGFFLRRDVT